MYPIIQKKVFNSEMFEMEITAPRIARKAKAGQFCILIAHENGERAPFTLADWNSEKGSITLVIQVTGKTSHYLKAESSKSLPHVSGPLGHPSEIDTNAEKVVFVGGGLGVGAIHPIMKAYREQTQAEVTGIVGFRSEKQVFWKENLEALCDDFYIATEDGSQGIHGMVTDPLEEILATEKPDLVYAIGPLGMMKAVSNQTRAYKVKTIVSLNPIMVDGIGMCGACRVTIDGETHYACIEGPEFDGHLVDFDELILRNRQFEKQEEICFREYLTGKNYHG
jgi:NAD(P)H-flavin reductase